MNRWPAIVRDGLTLIRQVLQYGKNWITYLTCRFLEKSLTRARGSVFVDFHNALDRYGYLLLKSLTLSGYEILLRHNFRFFADPRRYAEFTFRIPGLRIVFNPPVDTVSRIYLSDIPGKEQVNRRWSKVVLVDTDIFSDEGQNPASLRVPYLMHPKMYQRGLYKESLGLRQTRRTMRVFFAGNTDPNAYGAGEFSPFHAVPRHELISHVRRELFSTELMDIDEAGDLPSGDEVYRKVVILRRKVTKDAWLQTLARSDFFLAAPGVVMPLCHSLIEALSVGTVPITEYPNMISPALRPGHNCIAFNGKDDLTSKLRKVLAMSSDEILGMREEVIRYSDEHLLPSSLAHSIETAEQDILHMYMVAGWDSITQYRKRTGL